MNHSELTRKLNSVGKRAFVEQFLLFQEYAAGRITRDQATGALVAQGVSNEAGASMRLGNAKLIFDAGLEGTALRVVMQSTRLPSSALRRARELWKQLPGTPAQ